jgi:hypothetical protein
MLADARVAKIAEEAAGTAAGTIMSVVSLALGSVPDSADFELPVIDFLSRSAALDPAYPGVSREHRAAARQTLENAFQWCGRRFPLRTPPDADGARRQSIRHVDVRSTRDDVLLGCSSADAPGYVVLGASWPVASHYRLASLIAHEAVHQDLFVRERSEHPVRPGSLGYSPWRRTIRPGRALWHSFWTFACQFSLLADSLSEEPHVTTEDAGLLRFTAAMAPRIECCLTSLRDFTVVDDAELRRCDRALRLVQDAADRMCACAEFGSALADENRVVATDYRTWADQLLSS